LSCVEKKRKGRMRLKRMVTMAFILVQFASVMVFGWGDRRIMKVENMQKY